MAKEIRENEKHEELKNDLKRILEEMEKSKNEADRKKDYVSVYHMGLNAKSIYENDEK